MAIALASLVLEAWHDLDRATANLSAEDAERRAGTASPISWSVAHCTHMVDSWLNVNFQGAEPHALLNGDTYRRGAAGDAPDWLAVQSAVGEVRAAASGYLESLREDHLAERIPYAGSIAALRETGFSPQYALMRIAAHHYLHIGEIAMTRAALGHDVGDYPGLLERCL